MKSTLQFSKNPIYLISCNWEDPAIASEMREKHLRHQDLLSTNEPEPAWIKTGRMEFQDT